MSMFTYVSMYVQKVYIYLHICLCIYACIPSYVYLVAEQVRKQASVGARAPVHGALASWAARFEAS